MCTHRGMATRNVGSRGVGMRGGHVHVPRRLAAGERRAGKWCAGKCQRPRRLRCDRPACTHLRPGCNRRRGRHTGGYFLVVSGERRCEYSFSLSRSLSRHLQLRLRLGRRRNSLRRYRISSSPNLSRKARQPPHRLRPRRRPWPRLELHQRQPGARPPSSGRVAKRAPNTGRRSAATG